MMRIASLVLPLWLGVIAIASAAQDTSAETRTGEPRLVAALFRSNWCGPCKVLEPRYERVMSAYDAERVERVRFDSSFGRRGALAERASEEGIRAVYDTARDATGFVLLIDRDTQDVLARITMEYSEADIAGAMEYALDVLADREAFGL